MGSGNDELMDHLQHSSVAALILAIQDTPDDDQLAGMLDRIDQWNWPRTDLHYWIKPLNRFDSILENVCASYAVGSAANQRQTDARNDERERDAEDDRIQLSDFTPRTKELVLSVLRFTRLLLDNATNRKLYASFDRMNDLLLTKDLDVLEEVLRLILRRAHQIASPGHAHTPAEVFNLTPNRILEFAKIWKAASLADLSMLSLAQDNKVLPIPSGIKDFRYEYYRKLAIPTANRSAGNPVSLAASVAARMPLPLRASALRPESPITPVASYKEQQHFEPPAAEGMEVIRLGDVTKIGRDATAIFADVLERHDLSANQRLTFLHQLRMAVEFPDLQKRRQFLRIRLLAISVVVHTLPEQATESGVFLYQPDLIAQIAELVRADSGVPLSLQTVAITAMSTLSHIRARAGEVTAALSVGVNHGLLMGVLRRLLDSLKSSPANLRLSAVTIADRAQSEQLNYVDAIFNFLMHMQSSGYAGNLLLGAGAVPVLVDFVKTDSGSSPAALVAAHRAVTFLDNFTYSYSSAVAPFTAAGGLQIFVERVSSLVKAGVERYAQEQHQAKDDDAPLLGYLEATLLKSLFRCIQRLMSAGTNAEGVRTLIDSSIVEAIRSIMYHQGIFGPQNYALAINIMLSFVHNEATSLAILQEAKLPEAFYSSIQQTSIEPSLDVLSAIPTAIGALCLNEAGLDEFLTTRLSILDRFFDCFKSEPHARILAERENAALIGTNFDELARHHPSLKTAIFDAITKLLQSLYDVGKDAEPQDPDGFRLLPIPASVDNRVSVHADHNPKLPSAPDTINAVGVSTPVENNGDEMPAREANLQDDVDGAKRTDSPMLTSITITGRFLEGFFTTPNHCKEYIRQDGLASLFRLLSLPCIPWDLAGHTASPGLTTLFLSMNEHSAGPIFATFLDQVTDVMAETSDFWQCAPTRLPVDCRNLSERVQHLLSGSAHKLLDSNRFFRILIRMQVLLAIASELWSVDAYMSQQPSAQLLSMLKGPSQIELLHNLCALHRACAFAQISVKHAAAAAMITSRNTASTMSAREAPEAPVLSPLDPSLPSPALDLGSFLPSATASRRSTWPEAQSKNAKALRSVFGTISDSIRIFLKGIMSLQIGRRTQIEGSQRKDATIVANAVAVGMKHAFSWPDTDVPRALDFTTTMAMFMSVLTASHRSSTASLQLIFLKALDKQGGIDRLVELFSRHSSEAVKLDSVKNLENDSDVKMTIIRSVSGMKVILGVLEALVTSKTLLHPALTLLVATDPASPSFFDPHTFLVKLRTRILPTLLDLWNNDTLASLPPVIVRAVFRCILRILEGQGETAAQSGAGQAQAAFPSLTARRPQTVVPSVVHTQTLVDMGFPRSACESALVRRQNNVQAATEYLITHPELVSAARAREAAEAQAGPNAVDSTPENASTEPPSTNTISGDATEHDNGSAAQDASLNVAQQQQGTPEGQGASIALASGDVDMADEGDLLPSPNEGLAARPSSTVSTPATEASKPGSRLFLDGIRGVAKAKFLDRSLHFAADHAELVFDIRDALKTLTFAEGSDTSDVQHVLAVTLDALSSGKLSTPRGDSALASSVRLLALLFSDGHFRRSTDACYETVMGPVCDVLKSFELPQEEGNDLPKWLAPTLLLAEMCLTRAECPKANDSGDADGEDSMRTEQEVPMPKPDFFRGPAFADERAILFSVSLAILSGHRSDTDVSQSVLRLLLILTRQPRYGLRFASEDGVSAIIRLFEDRQPGREDFQQMAIMILRHTIEDSETLSNLMTGQIKSWLARSRASQHASTFARDLHNVACRHLPTFIHATSSLCQLEDGPAGLDIVAKPLEAGVSGNGRPETVDPSLKSGQDAMQVNEANLTVTDKTRDACEAASSIMRCLLTASFDSVQAIVSTMSLSTEGAGTKVEASRPTPPAAAIVRDGTTPPPAARSILEGKTASYSYIIFLLSSIAELTAAYSTCKPALLQPLQCESVAAETPVPAAPTKLRKPSFLTFLLNDAVPTEAHDKNKTLDARKGAAISNLAINIVLALCSDPNRSYSSEVSTEIVTVRKAVIDAVTKAFKEAVSNSEPIDKRYGRLSSLSNLCTRLLTNGIDATVGSSNRTAYDQTLHMAKLMLDKNFAIVLTNVLASIDLNYPAVHAVLNAILTPIELLTKLVTRMSRAPATGALSASMSLEDAMAMVRALETNPTVDQESEDGHSEDNSVDNEITNGEQNVFSNSALGMYEGELEPAAGDDQYMSPDEAEDEGDEWGEDEEMMEEEVVVPSDVSDDSDGEDDDAAMANEMRDALESVEGGLDASSSENDEDEIEIEIEESDGEDEEDTHNFAVDAHNEGIAFHNGIADAFADGHLIALDENNAAFGLENDAIDLDANVANTAPWDVDDDHGMGNDNPLDIDDEDSDEDDVGDGDGDGDGDGVEAGGVLEDNPALVDIMDEGDTPAGEFQIAITASGPGQAMASLGIGPPGAGRRLGQSAQPVANAIGQHSLLVDNSDGTRSRSSREYHSVPVRQRARAGRGADYTEWMQSVEDVIGQGAGQLLEQIFSNIQGGGAPLPLPGMGDLRAGGGLPSFAAFSNVLSGITSGNRLGPRRPLRSAGARPDAEAAETRLVNEILANPVLTSCTTLDRWNDESAIFNGSMSASERATEVYRLVVRALSPSKRIRDRETQNQEPVQSAEEHSATAGSATGARDVDMGAQDIDQNQRISATDSNQDPSVSHGTDANQATPAANASNAESTNASAPPETLRSASTRPSWRERVEQRRRNAQSTPQSAQDDTSSSRPSVAPTSASAAVNTQDDNVSEVLSLAARLSAFQANSNAAITSPPIAGADLVDAAASQSISENSIHAASDAVATEADADQSGQDTIMPDGRSAGDSAPQAVADVADTAVSATPAERVTIEIRGSVVDITETGIDPTFLAALPDDMREEVLNQHFREARGNVAVPSRQDIPTSIDAEFLNALPPELRAEVMAQEAIERARTVYQAQASRAAEQPSGSNVEGQTTLAQVEMDPASFLASLDSNLRQTILLEQGEEMMESLPPHIVAEYQMLRERAGRRAQYFGSAAQARQRRLNNVTQQSTSHRSNAQNSVKVDAAQILDKGSLAALIRLLFFPIPLKKGSLQSILSNLCENSKTRVDVITILLRILYDSSRQRIHSAATVDQAVAVFFDDVSPSRAKMLPRSRSGPLQPLPGPATPAVMNVTQGSHDSSTATPSSLHGATDVIERNPTLFVERALGALSHLVASNEDSATFFLYEQDIHLSAIVTSTPKSQKKAMTASKRDKGKGKATDSHFTGKTQAEDRVYPIVILLSLLEQPILTQSPSTMEALTKLLAHITVPLRSLQLRTKIYGTAQISSEGTAPVADGVVNGNTRSSNTPTVSETKSSADVSVKGTLAPPQLPVEQLRLVVKILDLGECSSKMFTCALSLILNLWNLPDARAILSGELVRLAQRYGGELITDLTTLEQALDAETIQGDTMDEATDVDMRGDNKASTTLLTKLSIASSTQAKILRVLKTIEHAKAHQIRMVKRFEEEQAQEAKKVAKVEEATAGAQESGGSDDAGKDLAAQSSSTAANATGPRANSAADAESSDAQRGVSLPLESSLSRTKVEELYDGFDFSPVWTKLSECLTAMEQHEDGSSTSTLLPLIEAFLLVSSWSLEGHASSGPTGPQLAAGTPAMDATFMAMSPSATLVIP